MEINQSVIFDIIFAYRSYKGYILSTAFTDIPSLEQIKVAHKELKLRKVREKISGLTRNEYIELIAIVSLGQDENSRRVDFDDRKLQAQTFRDNIKDITQCLIDKRNLDDYLEIGLQKLSAMEFV